MNSRKIYRPLYAGVALVSEQVNLYGTIGAFGIDLSGNLFAITAWHVCSTDVIGGTYKIYQPDRSRAPEPIGHLSPNQSLPIRDIAAIRLTPNVSMTAHIVGLGSFSTITEPYVGQKLSKVGHATGLTEGVVTSHNRDEIIISPPPSLPPDYDLAKIGDSGASWIDQETGGIVGIHIQGSAAVNGPAKAVPFSTISDECGLSLP